MKVNEPNRPDQALSSPMIGALMRMLTDALRRRLLSSLHDAGYTDLVEAHLAVLRYPGPHGRRPSELAADTRMTRQAMNYLLGQLEQLGYLTRIDDPDDQRSKRVQLTKRGHVAMKAVQMTAGEIDAELQQELGPRQFDQFRRLLLKLNASSIVSSQSIGDS
jgi:DNA-binding MarR family transcriptional regulator